jgi:signal transduction histidine kinase
MGQSLAEFIDAERDTIVVQWETFARSLLPAGGTLTTLALRDHADAILSAIVRDMRSAQTKAEQAEKSKGLGEAHRMGEVGKTHAELRLESGFKLGQMVAEYRALRASILRLWEGKDPDPRGVTRFNEAIDEALTVAVDGFMEMSDHHRDMSLGILSHDLRNPLSAITAGATLLINGEELSDKSVKTAARMLNSARRMNRMIGDLLDLTRTRFGDLIPITPAPIDLDPVCRQVVAELEGVRPSGVVRFTGTGGLRGDWDGDRIAQVLSNLVRNAIQHGSTDDPITVVAKDCGHEVSLEVHNRGPPIPPNALTTIFEPMVRHAADEQKNTGLGLGLYIAWQIVLAHGGTLNATSTAAAGTTFSVRLPRLFRAPQRT